MSLISPFIFNRVSKGVFDKSELYLSYKVSHTKYDYTIYIYYTRNCFNNNVLDNNVQDYAKAYINIIEYDIVTSTVVESGRGYGESSRETYSYTKIETKNIYLSFNLNNENILNYINSILQIKPASIKIPYWFSTPPIVNINNIDYFNPSVKPLEKYINSAILRKPSRADYVEKGNTYWIKDNSTRDKIVTIIEPKSPDVDTLKVYIHTNNEFTKINNFRVK